MTLQITPDRSGFETLMRAREGEVLNVYADTKGIPTCGIGHKVLPADNLELGDIITQAQCDAFFAVDGDAAWEAAVAQADQAGITSAAFLPWLASVNFQLGTNWIAKFASTWEMICAGDYDAAADHIGTLPWASETPVRVADFAGALRALPSKETILC
jgi:GH24 family phage-related lysozyme (muramidase)